MLGQARIEASHVDVAKQLERSPDLCHEMPEGSGTVMTHAEGVVAVQVCGCLLVDLPAAGEYGDMWRRFVVVLDLDVVATTIILEFKAYRTGCYQEYLIDVITKFCWYSEEW